MDNDHLNLKACIIELASSVHLLAALLKDVVDQDQELDSVQQGCVGVQRMAQRMQFRQSKKES